MRASFIAICLAAAIPAAAQDLDRDGLSDRLEQSLLEKFIPTLLLAAGECDGVPASLVPLAPDPRISAKDATLYGQAFPVRFSEGRAAIELHFFHLWSRDCGRLGHDLDAEHVSAIVTSAQVDAPVEMWVANQWYAAAHERSACDASSAARAGVIGATASGPRIYVSKGKHASYFDRGQCKWGCGGDECGDERAITATRIINIGEIDAPLNGAVWARSDRWPMREKFASASTTGALGHAIRAVGRFLRRPLRTHQ